jgi:predicted CopG family antitoxin
MSKTITIADELHKRLSEFGNRDESYNTIISRVLKHTDEDEAQNDRKNRITTYEKADEDKDALSGNPAVEALEDGTEVRWTIDSGEYDDKRTGEVEGGRIKFRGSTWRPSGFAREADREIRGDDARSSESYAGPREVEYQNEDGEWVSINSVLEE